MFSNKGDFGFVFIAFLVAQFCSCLSYLRLSYFSQFVCSIVVGHLVSLVLLKFLEAFFAGLVKEGWVIEGRHAELEKENVALRAENTNYKNAYTNAYNDLKNACTSMRNAGYSVQGCRKYHFL
jgi:hypothetical protein